MVRTRMFLFLLGFLFLTLTVAMAQYPVIDAEQLKSHVTGKKKVLLIDARPAEEYLQGHIPGAINIMPDHMKASGTRLPKDKSAAIIFYCRGVS